MAMPAKEVHVALYLQHLGDSSQSKAAVKAACNTLAWIHSTAGLPSTTISPFVKATLEGMQRILAKLTVKKDPVTSITFLYDKLQCIAIIVINIICNLAAVSVKNLVTTTWISPLCYGPPLSPSR